MDQTAELASLLFGVGADELVSKLSPEQKRKKSERTQGQVALASNAVGLAAGVAGTGAALRDDRFEEGGKWAKKLYARTKKIPSPISGKTGKAGAALAGGALALQAGNIGGDIVANRVLSRSQKNIEKSARGRLLPVVTGVGGVAVGSSTGYQNRKSKGRVRKMDPGTADVHIPSASGLKRKAVERGTKKAIKAYTETYERRGGRLAPTINPKIVNGTPEHGQGGTIETFERGKGKTHVQKSVSTEITWEGEFSKVNDDKRQVFGWASIVEMNGEPVVDLQGDYIDIDEIEKSAYDYVVKSRKGGEMHRRDGEMPVHVSDMIESFIVTPEKKEKMGLPDDMPTGWWVGYQINDDDAWNLVKSGKRTGFSIHGRGNRTPTMM